MSSREHIKPTGWAGVDSVVGGQALEHQGGKVTAA